MIGFCFGWAITGIVLGLFYDRSLPVRILDIALLTIGAVLLLIKLRSH